MNNVFSEFRPGYITSFYAGRFENEEQTPCRRAGSALYAAIL